VHELSVCEAMLRQVADIAIENDARSVACVCVGIGPLAGVEPHLLEQAYPLACAGTMAEGSELVINAIPVRVRCTVCEYETDALPNRLVCGNCGEWRTELISGNELLLERVELIRD
jgi:hydrogenase nickel incorporation protein HypA/HybF